MRKQATLQFGRREVYAILIGALLYGGLSWLTNVFRLQAADLQIRPGVAVPIFFGLVFGPIVGFFTGALGNLMNDLISGILPYPPVQPLGIFLIDPLRSYLANWQIGNGLMGLIPGIAAMLYRRYFTWQEQLRALAFTVAGILIGIGFAAFSHIWVDLSVNLATAWKFYFVPVVRVNLVNAIVLVPILLFNYERFDLSSTDWLRSDLMRRLSAVILISSALPVALLGLFLSQQTTGGSAGSTEVAVKLGFTVLLTLIFTITNAGLLAQSMTRPLLRLTKSAQLMEAGQLPSAQAGELEATKGDGEIERLSQVFGKMAREVILREERLRQEVQALRIEIDESKRQAKVAEVTGSDYFRELQQKARKLRQSTSDEETTEEASPDNTTCEPAES